jgi:hypothetical protein
MLAFEIACAAVIAATLAAMIRRRGDARAVLAEYAILAFAGWIGEHTCIAVYEHYAYAAGWHLFIGHVPLLIPLIWPLVILSARDVAGALGARGRWRAPIAGAIVVFDAALVEVIATAAGLWSWAEPGHLGVPLIGILGWGLFATAALALLDAPVWKLRLAAIVAAPLATHAALCAIWWALLRWVLRGDLGGISVVALCAISAALTAGAIAARRRGRGVDLEIALPRVLAAALFFSLLARPEVSSPSLWICAAASAAPYLVITRYKVKFAGSPSSSQTRLPSR